MLFFEIVSAAGFIICALAEGSLKSNSNHNRYIEHRFMGYHFRVSYWKRMLGGFQFCHHFFQWGQSDAINQHI
jgi:hypothetical protein